MYREASSAIGWAISLRKQFIEGGEEDITCRISPMVRLQLPGVDPRLVLGYSCLLYFAEKVFHTASTFENSRVNTTFI